MENKKILEIKNLVKDYGTKGFRTKVLRGVSLDIYENDFIAIMGPSGSGKTTLLNILSTIDHATSGTIRLNGKDITHLKNKELSKIRKDKIGFIFQDYNLLDTMTLQDNIALPLSLHGTANTNCIAKTKEMAALFGLSTHLKKYPYQLSGGQKQRGAACRALITAPEIIFADEPTGALDSKSSRDLLECLKHANEEGKATIMMVTHDAFSASFAKEVYLLNDGMIKCKLTKGKDRKEFYDRIIDVQASIGSDFV
ncbi:ABC transporter ATP-binding protein [Massilicoli timonensis]|uniref:ABC transporter ATP-binding protein n=1 Tax=Massilicoli timonensis TaxID=2015901 RepID=UPI000C84E1DC|nr:ABC transporter ATP-binding protein [Massilicoli timonensis]